jgi:hypothetical protein
LLVAARTTSKMGKKKAVGEKVKVARENGFDDDMTCIDDCPVFRDPAIYGRLTRLTLRQRPSQDSFDNSKSINGWYM